MSDESGWVFVQFDERAARRHGLPRELPVPKAQFESLADKGVPADQARKWISEFLQRVPSSWRMQNGALASKLEAFLAKGTSWSRAQQAFAHGDFAKAVSALQMIARVDPDDHAAKLNLALAHANAREHDKALARFAEIRVTFEGDPEFHTTFASVLASQGKKDEAIAELVAALEAKPDHKPALDALVKLGVLVPIYEDPRDAKSLTYVRKDSVGTWLADVWNAEPRSVEYFLEQIAYHEGEGRYDVVLAAAERALAAAGEAGNERAEQARVAALRALGRTEEANSAAKAWAERAPKSAAAHVELAQNAIAASDLEGARALLDRALELDPGDQLALSLRFWPSDRNDIAQVAAAIPALRAFAEAHAEVAGAWRSLARAELAAGKIDDALATFAKAVALAPSDDDLRAELWTELARQRKFAEVLEDAAKLGDMKTRAWPLRWAEAEAYAGLGRKMEAQGAFTAINLDESLPVEVRKRAKRAVQHLHG